VISLQTLHALRRLVPMPQLWPPAQGAAFTLLGGYLKNHCPRFILSVK
jgi:hypothetical protein